MNPRTHPKPLAGWRVLVPRGGEWGNSIASELRLKGAEPVVAPMINFAAADQEPLMAALARLEAGEFDWLVVTSATTIDVLIAREVRIPPTTRVAAIGETTVSGLQLAGYRVDFSPADDMSAQGLISEWREVQPGARTLFAKSDADDPALTDAAEKLGLAAEFVVAYRVVGVPVGKTIVEDVSAGSIRAVLITSASVAEQVREQLAPLPEGTLVAAIGPNTASDTRRYGLSVDVVAESLTADALIDALVEYQSR